MGRGGGGGNAVAALVVALMLVPAAAQAQGAALEMSAEARAYLTAALDTIEAVTLGGDTLSWPVIRDSAFVYARGARTTADTYGAVDWALRRANKHSFLQAASPGAVSVLLDGRFGYVRVPSRGGPATALADSLHSAIAALASAGACGWVVDLRGNGGGNMWPMLAGVGPLLGDSVVGYFGQAPQGGAWFYRRGVSGIRHPGGAVDTISRITVPAVEVSAEAPVAVLMDGGTGSSGEALAVAFRGRARTRSFGSATAGYATVNRGSRLPDGANMVVTTGRYADRAGRPVGDGLQPDEPRDGGVRNWPFPTDVVAREAVQWLAGQSGCTAPGGPSATRREG